MPVDVISLFLDGARAVASAIAEPSIAEQWDAPSVLADQHVSGVAGHLARGGVWVVGEYLDGGIPPGPVDFDSAAAYFASFSATASADGHQAIRDRGAAVGAVGQAQLVLQLQGRLAELDRRLRSLDPGQLVAVIGAKVMRLDSYLTTRIVEQSVHLDDLARSTGREEWPYPAAGEELAIEVGLDVARRRSRRRDLLRAVYRGGFAESVLPVL